MRTDGFYHSLCFWYYRWIFARWEVMVSGRWEFNILHIGFDHNNHIIDIGMFWWFVTFYLPRPQDKGDTRLYLKKGKK